VYIRLRATQSYLTKSSSSSLLLSYSSSLSADICEGPTLLASSLSVNPSLAAPCYRVSFVLADLTADSGDRLVWLDLSRWYLARSDFGPSDLGDSGTSRSSTTACFSESKSPSSFFRPSIKSSYSFLVSSRSLYVRLVCRAGRQSISNLSTLAGVFM